MPIGMIVLIVAAILLLFGVGQRVLDKMKLTDRAALLITAALFLGGLLPGISLGRVEIGVGGALVPLGVCAYLLITAGTGKERFRAAVASLATACAVYLLGRFLPAEPEQLHIEPIWLYGAAGGLISWVLGRSRRSAFIAGLLGVFLADTAVAVQNWTAGGDQTLRLGTGGALDAAVLSAFIAVLLCELTGEIVERAQRGAKRKAPAAVGEEGR